MSTAPNYRELFNVYHDGFDNYGRWFEHHKAMHAKHPLECAEFGAEWLRRWEAVGRLLERQAEVWEYEPTKDKWMITIFLGERADRVHTAIAKAINIQCDERCRLQVRLYDGTIIKEWGAK